MDGIFGYISSLAMLCYVFLLMVFINAERNKIVKSFLLILVSMIMWTGGSFLMRLLFWPSYVFWYHVSLGGILLVAYSYFNFIAAFTGEKVKGISRLYLFLLVGSFIINIPNGILLKWPSLVTENGITKFIYDDITLGVAILFLISGTIISHMIWLLVKAYRKNTRLKKRVAPIILGILALFIGNLALMLPIFSGFPIDIVAGVLNAALLLYALIRRHIFKLKFMATESIGYLFCVLLGFPVFYKIAPFLDTYIVYKVVGAQSFQLPIYLLSFALVVSLLFYIWKKVIANIFIKEDEEINDIVKTFSTEVSKTLKLNDILHKTVEAIRQASGIKKLVIGLNDFNSEDFKLRYSDQSLADLSYVLRKDNPIISWLRENDQILFLDEFEHTVAYKSLWEEEKYQLSRLEAKYCIGLKENGKLIGIVLFSDFGRKTKLKQTDLNIIESICSVASIALNNAHTYEKAYLEARTDDLTGVLNRKYFFEIVAEVFEKYSKSSLALITVNLDDFKLYNQLYGVKQADETLRRIAETIKASIGEQGYIARYSGKEFSILLPNYDVYNAKRLAESIRDQIGEITTSQTGDLLKRVTVSIGISVAPYGAKTVRELIDNADQAVFQVKRKGKNAIRVFDTYITSDKHEEEVDYSQVYDDYKSTVLSLMAAIDAKDHYTFNHSDNVAKYAVDLAKELKLNQVTVEHIRQAALLHDIGKISIAESVLNKTGRLNNEEFEIMKGHVEASINIIRHLPSLDYVIPAVLGHHERYDGKGYPRRIAGEDIPLTARILCIADSFDAMISVRCYKPEMSIKDALRIIDEESGKQFDPMLVHVFSEMIMRNYKDIINKEKLKAV
ncbi:MAG: diguanylate cyclase with GAF sensor [Fusobacteria bacterium]|nr:MAG: diguanylate cyclase with GAF sensor [Fusobacteriota bacterium]KAF0228569.1 MAG: diguanylate cyclase with GAF [Fusobacteriota bacterium]